MNFQKRIVGIFKTFVQRVFLPHLPKQHSSFFQWNKFFSLISSDSINLGQLQNYIDTLQPLEKKDTLQSQGSYIKKIQQKLGVQNNQEVFNPSKTFGGEKSKMPVYSAKQQIEDPLRSTYNINSNLQKQDPVRYRSTLQSNPNIPNVPNNQLNNNNQSGQSMLMSLEKLYKNLLDNQQKIQNLTQITPITNGTGVLNLGNQSYY